VLAGRFSGLAGGFPVSRLQLLPPFCGLVEYGGELVLQRGESVLVLRESHADMRQVAAEDLVRVVLGGVLAGHLFQFGFQAGQVFSFGAQLVIEGLVGRFGRLGLPVLIG